MIVALVTAIVFLVGLGAWTLTKLLADLAHKLGQWRRDRIRRRAGLDLGGCR